MLLRNFNNRAWCYCDYGYFISSMCAISQTSWPRIVECLIPLCHKLNHTNYFSQHIQSISIQQKPTQVWNRVRIPTVTYHYIKFPYITTHNTAHCHYFIKNKSHQHFNISYLVGTYPIHCLTKLPVAGVSSTLLIERGWSERADNMKYSSGSGNVAVVDWCYMAL